MVIRKDEKNAFLEFCKSYGLEFDKFTPKDPPDFIDNSNSLGIELVEYHKDYNNDSGSKMREMESNLNDIINKAKKVYKTKGEINVNVFFFPSYIRKTNLKKHKKNILVSEISNFVFLNRNSDKENFEIPEAIENYFESITIYPTPDYEEEMIWQVVEAAIISVNEITLKNIIEKKEEKLSEYRNYAKKIWLVIYSSPLPCVGSPDIGRTSTCGHISSQFKNKFITNFDKVIFFDRGTKQYLEISNK